MKTEINLENKAKFFAHYWGQHVIEDVNNSGEKVLYPVSRSNMYRFDESILVLKPLSSITDEDAIEVVEIVKSIGIASTAMHDPQRFLEPMKEGKGTTHIIAPVVDYLRSKGYALPWMGLSVEEMVEAGWIKLIEI